MRNLFLTRGCPGSGKSYWVKQAGLEPYELCADNIRLQIQSPVLTADGNLTISLKNDKRVWDLLFQMLIDRCKNGEAVVVCATHSKESEFAKYKDILEKYRYRAYCVDFSDVPLETIKAQNRAREKYKFVPEKSIENIYSRLKTQKVPGYIKVIKPEDFSDVVNVKPLDFNKYENVYILGDLHSCWNPLDAFLKKYQPTDKDYVISLGDTFDRGPQTKEVLKWLVEWHNRPNFLMVDSNHHSHFHKYAYGDESDIRSNEFLFKTKPEIVASGYDLGVLRNICRKVGQMAYFSYGNKNYFVNHGGISNIPIPLGLIATREFIFGTGRYEEWEAVANSWIENMPDNEIQVFGHRSGQDTPLNYKNRCYILENAVEHGGNFRALQINKHGAFGIEIKNEWYQKPEEIVVSQPETPAATISDIKELVKSFEGSRDVYKIELPDHIDSYCFKKDVFYKDTWHKNKELPRGFFVNKNGEIVMRGYNKFFNLNEKPETKIEILRETLVFPVNCYEKSNGFLGLAGYNSMTDSLVLASKSSTETEFKGWFERILFQNHGEHVSTIKAFLKENNKCFTFEVIDPINDPHIIEYNSPKIVLLDCFDRGVATNKMNYDELTKIAARFGFEVKKRAFVLKDVGEFNNFIRDYDVARRMDITDIEGFVLEDAAGFMFKKKLGYYQFWKYMRTIVDKVKKRHPVNLGSFTTPLHNEFYGFVRKLGAAELDKGIIYLRKQFEDAAKKQVDKTATQE